MFNINLHELNMQYICIYIHFLSRGGRYQKQSKERIFDQASYVPYCPKRVRVRVMVFNSTFGKISVISWRSVLLVEETGVPEQNHSPVASH